MSVHRVRVPLHRNQQRYIQWGGQNVRFSFLEMVPLAASNLVSSCFYPRPHKPEHGTSRGRLDPTHAWTLRKVARMLGGGGGGGAEPARAAICVGFWLASNTTIPACGAASLSVSIPSTKQYAACLQYERATTRESTFTACGHAAALRRFTKEIKIKERTFLAKALASSFFCVHGSRTPFPAHFVFASIYDTCNSQRVFPKQSPVLLTFACLHLWIFCYLCQVPSAES